MGFSFYTFSLLSQLVVRRYFLLVLIRNCSSIESILHSWWEFSCLAFSLFITQLVVRRYFLLVLIRNCSSIESILHSWWKFSFLAISPFITQLVVRRNFLLILMRSCSSLSRFFIFGGIFLLHFLSFITACSQKILLTCPDKKLFFH